MLLVEVVGTAVLVLSEALAVLLQVQVLTAAPVIAPPQPAAHRSST